MRTTRSYGLRCALLVACGSAFALLSGCVGDGNSPTGSSAASTNSSAAPLSTASGTTSNPTINLSGTPPASVVAGNLYVFQPTVSTSSGTATFTATGLPSWASLDAGTGAISGTPASGNVGTTGNITLTASDGSATASLPPFTIDVTASSSPTAGTVSLSWVAPTDNTNGTPVTALAGYHIHYGTSADALDSVIDVPGAATTEYEISNLSSGTYYFTVSAYNSLGVESAASDQASKTI